eukprot:tig00000042_g15561.t1
MLPNFGKQTVTNGTLMPDGSYAIPVASPSVVAPVAGSSSVITIKGSNFPYPEPIEIFVIDPATGERRKAPYAEIWSSSEIRFLAPSAAASNSSSTRARVRHLLLDTEQAYNLRIEFSSKTYAAIVIEKVGAAFKYVNPTSTANSIPYSPLISGASHAHTAIVRPVDVF